MIRRLALVLAFAGLAACGRQPLEPTPEPIGDFRLGHAIAIADEATKGPFSRDISDQELEAALSSALRERLGRYDGDGLYHLGVNVGGYVLAQPGVPVVYTPKSVLVLDVNLFDNATQERINDEPKRIFAFEGIENTRPLIGSGWTRGKQAQLDNLAFSAARQIESWLEENPQWFEPEPGQVRVPYAPPTNAN